MSVVFSLVAKRSPLFVMPHLDEDTKIRLVVDSDNGMNITQIAKKYKVTHKTARLHIRRYKNIGSGQTLQQCLAVKAGRGRTKLINKDVAKEAVAMLLSNEFDGTQHVANELHKQGKIAGKQPPHRTTLVKHVRQAAKEMGTPLHLSRAQPVKELTAENKAKRLAFAKANKSRNWGNVMFTDRKKFLLKYPRAKVAPCAWVVRGQRRIAPVVSKPMAVNVYAGITKYGVTKLHFVAGTNKLKTTHKNKKGQEARNVTASQYKEVVAKTLLPEGKRIFSVQGISHWVLQQDNDPCHKVASQQALSEWNVAHGSGIEILPNWPPNSPDLSPIENVWGIVQTRVDKAGCENFEQFKAKVEQEFHGIAQGDTLKNMFQGMRKRLDHCITLQGDKTKH